MKGMYFILRKEFRQIFRNATILKLIVVMPIVQLLVMPLAADYEIKNIRFSWVDHDKSAASNELLSKLSASGYFQLNDQSESYAQAMRYFEMDASDLIIEIPRGLEQSLLTGQSVDVFVGVNAINGVKAMVGNGYFNTVLQQWQAAYLIQHPLMSNNNMARIEVVSLNRFNPLLNYQFFMVPGILVILVTMIASYMCALNIVKEKETGTMEQLNVTPIKKSAFLIGKLLPFWIIGMLVFTLGLFGVARLVYQIVPIGSIGALYLFLAVYLVALLGIGLLISTYAQTQQQAMSIAFFFVMIFILMSGLFTPLDGMPKWAQVMADLNPVRYFIEVVRLVVLKGSGIMDIWPQLLKVTAMALVFNAWALLNFRKTIA